MPLSTVLGAQSLIKPGVCTTATRPSSPYTGQMIYDTTVSQALVWNGTAWVGTGGKIAQVVQGQTSTQVTSAGPLVDSGVTATITPTLATSKILLMISMNGVSKITGSSSNGVVFRLLRGATNIGGDGTWAGNVGYNGADQNVTNMTWAYNYLDSPATTSATIYKVQFQNNTSGSAVRVQDSTVVVNQSTITLFEVLA